MPTIAQWANRLHEQIDAQVAYQGQYEVRYRNDFVVPFLQAEYRDVYGDRADAIRPPRVGAAAITVDGLTERLTVLGATSDSAEAAKVVDEAWADCDLDVMHREAHREALIKARSFAQVDRTRDGRAVVGIEAADQVAVHREQGPPYDVDAAMKVYDDEWTGQKRAIMWVPELPGRRISLVYGSLQPDWMGSQAQTPWSLDGEPDPTPFSRPPVVEFAHMARLLADPRSEIDPIDTLVDAADLIEGLMLFAGHFGAVPIRYGTGLSPLRDPQDPTRLILDKDGKPILGFDARADRFWGSTEKDAKFGQMEPASLETFVRWAEHVASRLRAQTSLASTYYSMDLRSHMSAELLKTDEAPMVRRLRSIGERGPFGQAWRRLMGLMLVAERPDLARARVFPRWEATDTRIESQQSDMFVKLVSGGMGPQKAAQMTLGWSPEDIRLGVEEGDRRQARAAAMDMDPMLALLNGSLADSGAVNDPFGNG